ncbi:hypothetical protein BG004_006769, partial [Podila humilis]
MSFPSLLSDHEQKAFSQFVTHLAQEENARNQHLRSTQQYGYSGETPYLSPPQNQLQHQHQHQHQHQPQNSYHQHQHHEQGQGHSPLPQVLPSQNEVLLSAPGAPPSISLPLPTDTRSLHQALAQHQRDWIHQMSANPLLAPGGTIDPHAMSQAILQNPELMAQANAITQAMVLAQQQQQQQQQQRQQTEQHHYKNVTQGAPDAFDTYHAQQHHHHQHHHHRHQQHYHQYAPPLPQQQQQQQQQQQPQKNPSSLKQEPPSPISPRSTGYGVGGPQRYNIHHDRSRSITPPSVPSQNGYHSSTSSTSPKRAYEQPPLYNSSNQYPQLPPPIPNYHLHQHHSMGQEGDYDNPVIMPAKKAARRKGSSASSSISNESSLSSEKGTLTKSMRDRASRDSLQQQQQQQQQLPYTHHEYNEPLEEPAATTAAMTSKTGGTKKQHELLTDAEKKANHIASEQKRRQNIRIGFDSLVDIVPSLSDCHRSEALILQKSVDYIQRLLHQKNQLKNKVRDLQNNLGESLDDDDS